MSYQGKKSIPHITVSGLRPPPRLVARVGVVAAVWVLSLIHI